MYGLPVGDALHQPGTMNDPYAEHLVAVRTVFLPRTLSFDTSVEKLFITLRQFLYETVYCPSTLLYRNCSLFLNSSVKKLFIILRQFCTKLFIVLRQFYRESVLRRFYRESVPQYFNKESSFQ